MQLLSTLFFPLLNCLVLNAYLPRLIRNHTLRIRVRELLRRVHKVMGMHAERRTHTSSRRVKLLREFAAEVVGTTET